MSKLRSEKSAGLTPGEKKQIALSRRKGMWAWRGEWVVDGNHTEVLYCSPGLRGWEERGGTSDHRTSS